ncbi:MAG: hypothetical protein QNL88_09480 [Acidobacteriota bacterium]|nr:hypothetical protein [Acidobacteriota bacterium]
MVRNRCVPALLFLAAAALLPPPVSAQAIPTNGRFSLFYNWSERDLDGGYTSDFSEVIARFSMYSEPAVGTNFEFGIDARAAMFPGNEGRDGRVSIYDAWVGYRGNDGRWTLRLGQMWLRNMGGIGAIGGLFGEYQFKNASDFGQFRVGLFAGAEPKIRDVGFVDGITKGGAYVAVDAAHGRRHVLGWVLIRNEELTERSIVVFNNFIPVKRKFSLYQALEYDLEGPAGLGDPELGYFFANMRYAPVRLIEFQGTYHRGRSLDARSITDDVLDGRPVDPERLQGLLFESGRLRVNLRPWRWVRFWISYGRDRNNSDDEWADRANLGLSLNNIAKIGLDFSASTSRINRLDREYDSTWVSLGKTIGRRVYLSLDYLTSLSVFQYNDGGGGTIEVRPESKRYSLSMNANVNKTFSLLLVIEQTDHDDYDEVRALTGLTIRF